MNNKLITVLAKHIILTFLALEIQLILMKRLTTIITEEPIVFKFLRNFFFHLLVLLLFLELTQDIVLELLFFLFSLFTELFLFLFFTLLDSFTFFLTGFRLNSHRFFDFSGILNNLISIRLLKSKIVLSLMLIHFYTSFLIFLIYFLNLILISLLPCQMFTQPLFVHNIVSQENISLVHFLWMLPNRLNKLLSLWFHFLQKFVVVALLLWLWFGLFFKLCFYGK